MDPKYVLIIIIIIIIITIIIIIMIIIINVNTLRACNLVIKIITKSFIIFQALGQP